MKRKIMISVMLLALIPAVLIGCAVNYYIQNTVRTDKLDALAGTAHMMTVHLDGNVERLVADIERKTEANEVESVLSAGSSPPLSPETLAVTDRILMSSIGGNVLSGAVIDRNGKTVFFHRTQ